MIKKILLFIFIYSVKSTAYAGVVSVTGEAEFELPPDMFHISFSISNLEIKNIENAKKYVDSKSTDLAAALISFGIDENDIQSPFFNIDGEPSSRERCIEKWVPRVSREITVTLRDLGKYNKLLDLLVKHGVTRIDEVDGDLQDIDKHNQRAMELAILDAKARAHFLASNFGAKLGKIKTIGNREALLNGSMEERLIVAGIRASKPEMEAIPYEFKPSDVYISASIYAEFNLK